MILMIMVKYALNFDNGKLTMKQQEYLHFVSSLLTRIRRDLEPNCAHFHVNRSHS
jgi:hypothetical protein